MVDGETINTDGKMLQLIYYDLTFNGEFKKFIKTSKFDKNENRYNSIAIIGCQSSGKSTLLNCLFNTNFEVMNAEERVGQTTKGIWVAFNSEHRICILDCEGTDSKERGEDRGKFEHCSSLFALALSDVLVINMWSSDVGRYTASNYGVLKIVFEMNLKLFQQECEKKLIIVLRDFSSKQHNFDKIRTMIKKDIDNIWKEIRKPDSLANSSPDKFFQVEFIPLPHKIYFEEEFTKEVQRLGERFNPNHSQYIFNHSTSSKGVPADGFDKYCLDIWDTILKEKDLNLPSQKEMLATYRCNEIKEQAIVQYEKELTEFNKKTNNGFLDNFKTICEQLMLKILTAYDETAKNYYERIYKEVRETLITFLLNQFYIGFSNQGRLFIPMSQKHFKKDIEKELKTNENFTEIVGRLRSKHIEHFVNSMKRIQLTEHWDLNLNSIIEIFDDVITNFRKTQLSEKKKEQTKKIKKQIDDCLIKRLEDITPNFWVDFNTDYLNFIYIGFTSFKSFLEEYYAMSQNEFIEFSREMEEELFNQTQSHLNKKFKEISSFAAEVFRKKFWNTDLGVPRQWNRVEESEIESLYKQYKNECHILFELFKTFRLIRYPIKIFNYERNESVLNDVTNNIKSLIEIEENHRNFYKADEILVFRRKFDEMIEAIYDDARRRHASIFKNNLPWWGWALIIYLGYDDFLRLITSYWIIPVTLLLGLYGALHALGLGTVPRQIFYMFQDTVIKKVEAIFNR